MDPSGFGQQIELVVHGEAEDLPSGVVDALAARRDVITFDDVGVGTTTGTTPRSFEETAAGAIGFVEALEPDRVDLLGSCMPGCCSG